MAQCPGRLVKFRAEGASERHILREGVAQSTHRSPPVSWPRQGNGAQCLEGYLGVDCGSGLRAMPEDLRDLRHGGAVSNHFGCQTVSEQMGSAATRAANAGSGERPPYNMTNSCRTSQTNTGRPHP